MAAPTREGSCDHPATKADVEGVRSEMKLLRADMERFRADVARWLFMLGVAVISAMVVIAGVAVAVFKFVC